MAVITVAESRTGANAHIDKGLDDDTKIVKTDVDGLSQYDALLYEHPDYTANFDKWKKFEDCYEGEDIYRFIKQHTRETDDIFDSRVERGYYLNYCKSVVDLFVAFLFHAPIERQFGDIADEFEEIERDANLAGDNYVTVIKDITSFGGIHGHVGVLVDATRGDAVQTEHDRRTQNVRPYLRRIKATQIVDWSLDRYNKFQWVKLDIRDDGDRDWDREVVETQRRFQIWTRADWQEWVVNTEDKTAEKVDEGEHTLGEVPLVIFRPNGRKKNHDWFGLSDLEDIADINIAILNWGSLADEEIAERCLNILTMPDPGDDKPIHLSHHNVLLYPPGDNKPEYMSLNETPLKLIIEWMKNGKDEIFRLAKLSGSTGLLGPREATSGIAYAYEFNETNQTLSDKAQGMEQGEREIARLIAKWLGKEKFSGSIEYSDEFGVIDAMMMLTELQKARDNLTSETAIKTLEKKVVSKIFARSPEKLRSEIAEEIEKGITDLVFHMELTNGESDKPEAGRDSGRDQVAAD